MRDVALKSYGEMFCDISTVRHTEKHHGLLSVFQMPQPKQATTKKSCPCAKGQVDNMPGSSKRQR